MVSKSYRDLIAWQKSMDLVEMIYTITRTFPKEELYGLTSQVRRAAVSIPSNIAEGEGRNSKKEFSQFLSIAYGSLSEVETQIMIANRLRYTENNKCEAVMKSCTEIGKIINGLKRSLQ